jgi:hypothetical protein
VSNAQVWTVLSVFGVLLGVIGSLVVQQVRQVGDQVLLVGSRIDTRIDGLMSTVDARLTGFRASVDARFDAVNQRFDHLDRDVQAIARVVFPRE